MQTLVQNLGKMLDFLAGSLSAKVSDATVDIRYRRDGSTRVKLDFIIGAPIDDHKTHDQKSEEQKKQEFLEDISFNKQPPKPIQ